MNSCLGHDATCNEGLICVAVVTLALKSKILQPKSIDHGLLLIDACDKCANLFLILAHHVFLIGPCSMQFSVCLKSFQIFLYCQLPFFSVAHMRSPKKPNLGF